MIMLVLNEAKYRSSLPKNLYNRDVLDSKNYVCKSSEDTLVQGNISILISKFYELIFPSSFQVNPVKSCVNPGHIIHGGKPVQIDDLHDE